MSFGQIRWKQGLRAIAADWHKAVAISALLFNFVIAVTGAWLGWSIEALNVAKVQPEGSVQSLLVQAKRQISPRDDSAIRVDYDAVLTAARQALPGFEPRSLNVTRDGRRQVVLFGKPAGGIYASASNKVFVDKVSLAVTAAFDTTRAGSASKLYYVMEPLISATSPELHSRWSTPSSGFLPASFRSAVS